MHLYLYLFTFVVFDIFDFENTATFKSGSGSLKVIETAWYHSTDWLWFPISIL